MSAFLAPAPLLRPRPRTLSQHLSCPSIHAAPTRVPLRRAVVHMAKSKSDNAAVDTASLRERLLDALDSDDFDRGLAVDPDSDIMTMEESKVESLIEALEDANTVAVPTRDPRVFGCWELVYTSSSITRYFGGISGLQRVLPDGEVGRIRQTIDEELGTAVYDEQLEFDLPFRSDRVKVLAEVSGKIRATSQTRFVWDPEKIRAGFFSWFAETWKTVRAFQVSDITYLDDELRITRGQNGSVCVYARCDPDDDE